MDGSNKEARKRLVESNGTPAMDPGHLNIDLLNIDNIPDTWILIWRIHSHVVVKKTFAYANIQTNKEENKTQMHHGRLSLDLQTLFMLNMIIMWIYYYSLFCV